MKPKNFFKGISKLFLGGLLAYSLNTGDLKAQNSPSQVMDSTVVEKEILFDVHIYDETTGLPVEKAAADISGKLFDGDFYSGFETEDVYTFEGPISTDVNGNFSGGMILRTFQLVGVRDRQPLAPTGYALSNSWPEPFDNHSSLKVLTKERELADLVVYNILGQEVFRKKDLDLSAGVNTFRFSGLDALPSGMYLFTAEGDGFVMAEKGMKVDGFSGTSNGSSLFKSYNNWC